MHPPFAGIVQTVRPHLLPSLKLTVPEHLPEGGLQEGHALQATLAPLATRVFCVKPAGQGRSPFWTMHAFTPPPTPPQKSALHVGEHRRAAAD